MSDTPVIRWPENVQGHMRRWHGVTDDHWGLCADPQWCHRDDHDERLGPDPAVTPHTHPDPS